jgi:membrane-bound lytic murein transglycosylase D
MAAIILLNTISLAQGPRVPSAIDFADMKLKLNDHVRKEIQKEVDALHRSQRYFNIKLDRVNLYFPIIERILREENVPDDFKYLVIQESALISDAISTSNAVGFWQFKIPSAKEVGLRVDGSVDERLNITASTHGAAKYLKRNNFYFNNWVYALLAYQQGVGGANSIVNDKYFGAKKMDLNRRTHWYIIKFLAHKVAFEKYIGKGDNKRLYEYTDGGGQSLKQIAGNLGVDYNDLKDYNKWLKRGKVPQDKTYYVLIPGLAVPPVQVTRVPSKTRSEDVAFLSPNSDLYPKIKIGKEGSRIVKVNSIPGIIANDGDNLKSLALAGGIELSRFLKVNEIDISHKIVTGNVYYFKPKKSKAREYYHTVMPGEDLWYISQKYGVKEQKLLSKNRLDNENGITPGLVLWLRYIRSADQPVEYVQLPEEAIIASSSVARFPNDSDVSDQDNNDMAIEESAYEHDEFTQIVEDIEEKPIILEDIDDLSDDVDINEEFVDELTDNELTNDELTDDELTDDELAEIDRNKAPLFHVVEKGETLYAISRKYGISVNELLEINDLNNDDKIRIGQKIYLKNPFEENNTSTLKNDQSFEDSYITYTVKKGDTLYSLSKKYRVSIEDILKWNNKSNYNLKEGEILRIKDLK